MSIVFLEGEGYFESWLEKASGVEARGFFFFQRADSRA